MIQLTPGEQFVIARQITDPADSTTYYIRAYIRRLSDDSLIDTVNLTDKGDQRFRGNWSVANYPDPTYISILTKTFTDSGYTAESQDKARVEETYLIQPRWSQALGAGGGGGASVNYKKIQEIFDEVLKKYPGPVVNINNKNIEKAIKDIRFPKIPEQKETDLSGVTFTLNEVEKNIIEKIDNIYIPEVDLKPMMEMVETKFNTIEDLIVNNNAEGKEDLSTTLKDFKKIHTDFKASLEDYIKKLANGVPLRFMPLGGEEAKPIKRTFIQ